MNDKKRKRRKTFTAIFDVTELTERELEGLMGEVVCQAESSELHPSVEVVLATRETVQR